MIRERTDDNVVRAAAQMDAALASGVPAAELAVLVAARAEWQRTGDVVDGPELRAAVARPEAATWDAVFVKAARRKLSDPVRNVRS